MIGARAHRLEAVFRDIAATRMAGLPVCNTALQVQAIGFECDREDPAIALGVLLTPWFMNLVRLPLDPSRPALLREGESARRVHGGRALEFLGAFEPDLGPFESCSLFSPVFEFAEQRVAAATAREVLALLRRGPAVSAGPAPVATPGSRRAFLVGRRAAGSVR